MTASAETVLDAFIGLISERGFVEVTLRDVAAAADLGLADLYRLYPDKVALAAAFMARIDAAVLAGTPRQADPEETARDRLFDVMMRRYDALKPYRAALGAIRRAGTRDPLLALALGPALRRSMAAMLEAAALPSDGLTGAVRQNGLLAIHYAVAESSTAMTRSISRRPWRRSTAANTIGRLMKLLLWMRKMRMLRLCARVR